ncbi:hypothetical protein VA596_46920 [Amycolatopsis sp., V23-08]|uniref:Uncharacterized protein n=1 Tax=Amycolatopsis heterodermiae TaxID=3110235 RepID=A0ABU5RPE1_9PSEU|nr:hypothetical protein [Amycolatopsis sp., V23-08]MEA5367131.1 hypothetical protein [Amycolatopsis sp., V23-08]
MSRVTRPTGLLGRSVLIAPLTRLLALRRDGIRRLFVSATLSRDLLVTPFAAAELTEGTDVAWLGGLNHSTLQHATPSTRRSSAGRAAAT